MVTARPPRSSWPICAIAGNPLPSTRHCCTWIRFSTKGGRLEVQREMDRVFDRPTPYAKRGVVYDRASRQNLRAAVVVTGDRTKGGLPATAFLGPHIEGGMRTHKAFERQLVDRGLMQRDLVAVPAKRAPLDRYGNMTQGFLNRVMADLQIDYRGAGATRTRTSSSLKRNKNYKNARFFVPRQPSHLYPGVYQRDPATNAIHPVILFVPQVSYRIRLRLARGGRAVRGRQRPRSFRRRLPAGGSDGPIGRSDGSWVLPGIRPPAGIWHRGGCPV